MSVSSDGDVVGEIVVEAALGVWGLTRLCRSRKYQVTELNAEDAWGMRPPTPCPACFCSGTLQRGMMYGYMFNIGAMELGVWPMPRRK